MRPSPPPPPPRLSRRRPLFAGDALWLPNTTRPAWLDGSMAGDRGFDPLGLSKPTEYLQVDVSHAASQPPAESAPASSIAAATAAAAPAQHWLWTL